MKNKKPIGKKVLLWPERKVYEARGTVAHTQRVPLWKIAVCSTSGAVPVYYGGDPIVLN